MNIEIQRYRSRTSVGSISFLCFLCVCVSLCPNSSYAQLNKAALLKAQQLPAPRTHYDISVEIDPDSVTYSGHEKVTFHNRQKKPAEYLLFFIYPNDPSITKSNKKYMTLTHAMSGKNALRTEDNGPATKVYLPQPLQPGRSVTVEFDFDGSVPRQAGNKDLFSETMDQLMNVMNPSAQTQADYGIFSSGKEIVNLGMWYPALSKFDEDGWDQEKYAGIGDVSYFDPADFNVLITVPASCQVVTTGSVLKRVPLEKSRISYVVESTMTRDFAIELSPRYAMRTRLVDGTIIKSYFLTEHRESGELTAEAAVKAFEYYQKLIGPYPYTELDVVEAPLYGGAGGVEFPGLVTVSSMLYREPKASDGDAFQDLLSNSPAFDQLLEFVVAHEVAHQWWNAVVGSNSKRYPFVDEAMANYTAILYFENYYGREAAEKQMAMQMKVNYQLHRLLGGSDQAVDQPASAFHGALEYSAIVYGKGALYFDHLRQLMGDRPFYMALRAYYDSYWFRIAGPMDFTSVAQKQMPAQAAEIRALYQRWMEEKHGDEDIGPGSLDGLMKTIMPAGSDISMDQVDDLLKQLQDTSPEQMQDMMKQLEEILKQQQDPKNDH